MVARYCVKSWKFLVLWEFFTILTILPAAMVNCKFENFIAEYFYRVNLFGKRTPLFSRYFKNMRNAKKYKDENSSMLDREQFSANRFVSGWRLF